MSLKDWLSKQCDEREARTRRERHGQGELTLLDDVPLRATGCALPDGTITDAECLLRHVAFPDNASRVWTRCLPGSAVRRRGRLKVDDDKALIFVDEPDADIGLLVDGKAPSNALMPDLERDLGLSLRIRGLVRSELFATLLYSALCNTLWQHRTTGAPWRCSWRHAGAVVANLRCEGSYLDWYCSTGEGFVDGQVLAEIVALGWELAEADPPEW
jgi:hypothetical protein